MIFQLNGSEMADWQEVWCWRCAKDHGFSHDGSMRAEFGCPLLVKALAREDVPEFVPHTDWFRTIPANVSCAAFVSCAAPECQDGPVILDEIGRPHAADHVTDPAAVHCCPECIHDW